MKARAVLFVLLALVFVSMSADAQIVKKSAIVGSAHDLRTLLGVPSYATYTLCNFCHVAHKPAPVPTGAPGQYLWNHTLSAVTSYGVYSSPTFNALNTDIKDLGGASATNLATSNLCLSCHDGTVAVNSFYEPQPTTTTAIYATKLITDLTQTHPVNFTYNATIANTVGMLVPASTSSVDGAGLVPLYNGKLQCDTCHDPHNGGSGIFARPFPTQSSGTFCTYCHL